MPLTVDGLLYANIRMRAVNSKLANAWVVNPLYTLLPEYWYWTK